MKHVIEGRQGIINVAKRTTFFVFTMSVATTTTARMKAAKGVVVFEQ
jgi:hypothetical protein